MLYIAPNRTKIRFSLFYTACNKQNRRCSVLDNGTFCFNGCNRNKFANKRSLVCFSDSCRKNTWTSVYILFAMWLWIVFGCYFFESDVWIANSGTECSSIGQGIPGTILNDVVIVFVWAWVVALLLISMTRFWFVLLDKELNRYWLFTLLLIIFSHASMLLQSLVISCFSFKMFSDIQV